MAKRMIHTTIWASGQVAKLSRPARLLFIGLITLGDDDGRLKGSPALLRSQIFPYDEDVSLEDVSKWLAEIISVGLIVQYDVGSEAYLMHPKWYEYQTLRQDRKRESHIPLPPVDLQTTIWQPDGGQDDNQVSAQGKVRKGKISKDKINTNAKKSSRQEKVKPIKIPYVSVTDGVIINQLFEMFRAFNPAIYKLYGRKSERKALDMMCHMHGLEQVKKVIEILPQTNRIKYLPTITTPSQLEDNWAKLEANLQKKFDSGKGKTIIE